MYTGVSIVIAVVFILLYFSINILQEYERGVVFLLGKYNRTTGPGVVLIVPIVERLVRVDQRVVTMDVPPQDVITRDNVSIKVNAVVYFRVMDPANAIIKVENYLYATSQLAQTTLRSVCGEAELDQLLSERETLNKRIQEIIDHQTDPWGIKVTLVELKYIDLPQEMQRAMARQAEAERERRAKIIQAEGEYQAAAKLTQAAEIMAKQNITIQLRYLETLRVIATEKNSTIVFPVPIELVDALMGSLKKGQAAGARSVDV